MAGVLTGTDDGVLVFVNDNGTEQYMSAQPMGTKRVEVLAPFEIGKDDSNPQEASSSYQPAETRVTDPTTGGQKGSKLARFALIPADFLWSLAEHYGRGAFKYEDRNWERGYKWSLSLDALERHKVQWLLGEDNDTETGTHHLICVAWHAIALWWWQKRSKGTDDIRTKEGA